MIREEAIESFKHSNEQAKLRLKVEKMRMESGEIKELKFYIERDEMAIKALEQEPKWNLCSEDLPTHNGWYQCTVIINDLQLTMELFYKNGKWLDNRRINIFDTYDIYGYGNTTEKHKLSYQELISEFDWTKNVAAWMLLPKPYDPQEKRRIGMTSEEIDKIVKKIREYCRNNNCRNCEAQTGQGCLFMSSYPNEWVCIAETDKAESEE